MKVTKKSKFEQDCERVSEETDCGFYSPSDYTGPTDVYEDDGCLHIFKKPIHACFDVNRAQEESAKVQNEKTRKVLTALKMEKYITDRVLMDESEDEEDDECPHCGRGGYCH